MFLELQVVTYIRMFFCSLSRDIFVYGIFSFFGRFLQEVRVFCFLDSFIHKTIQESDVSCNVTIDTQRIWKLSEKQSVYFCKHNWKFLRD